MISRWKLQIDKGGGSVAELVLNAEPLPSFPQGPLGGVASLNVIATRTFKIPSTPASDVFFEHFPKINVVTDITKRALGISLLYAGSPVIENATVNTLNFDGKQYTLLISGGNAGLIKLLNNSLDALDWSAYSTQYTVAQQAIDLLGGDAETAAGLYYSASYHDGEHDLVTEGEFLLPSMKLETIYNEILSQNGILSSDLSSTGFETREDFKRQYIQLTTRDIPREGRVFELGTDPDPVILDEVPSVDHYLVPASFPADSYFWTKATKSFSYSTTSFTNAEVSQIEKNVDALVITYTADVVSGVANTAVIYAVLYDDSDVQQAVQLIQDDGIAHEISFTEAGAGVPEGWYVAFIVQRDFTGTFIYTFEAALSFTPDILLIGDTYELSANLPDLSQLDVFKYILNKYALLVDFDTVSNTIVFRNYESLIDQFEAGDFVDLTSKIVDAGFVPTDDRGGLAKENYLNFSNDSEVPTTGGRGVIALANENAPNSATIYDAPFSFSRTIDRSGSTQAAILPYKRTTEANDLEFEDIDLRVVYVDRKVQFATSYTEAIGFDYSVANFYAAYNDSNDDLKIITVSADLSWQDVQRITDATDKAPVVINYNDGENQISGLFKVNKVDRFTDRKATKLELKKLL